MGVGYVWSSQIFRFEVEVGRFLLCQTCFKEHNKDLHSIEIYLCFVARLFASFLTGRKPIYTPQVCG